MASAEYLAATEPTPGLPDELQLEIAASLFSPGDCGALCVANPRVGLVALRKLPQYKDPLVSVAMRLATGELQIDEALMRRYIWDMRMTREGCDWLTAAASKAGSLAGIGRSVDQGHETFSVTDGGAEGAKVRVNLASGRVGFYEGERGAERVVREERPGGTVVLSDGEGRAQRGSYVRSIWMALRASSMVRRAWGLVCLWWPRITALFY